jgi:hypothetical protein
MTFVEGSSGYALLGWNKLNDWAVLNDLTWARCGLETITKGLQHEDALRLLCAALLLEKHGQLWTTARGAVSHCDRCARQNCNEVYHADGRCMPGRQPSPEAQP